MKTLKHFGRSLACGALTMAGLISCSATGTSTEQNLPPIPDSRVKILASNVGVLNPEFDEGTLSGYEIEVPFGTTEIGFVYGDNTVSPDDVTGVISEDSNPFTVTLLIRGVEKTYSMAVIVMPSADISAVTLSATDFSGLSAIRIDNPAADIAHSAPFAVDTTPDIHVLLTLTDPAPAVLSYGGAFSGGWSGTNNSIPVAMGGTVTGSITVESTKTINEVSRVVVREYTLTLSRPSAAALAIGGAVDFIDIGEGKIDEVHTFINPTDTLTFNDTDTLPIANASLLVVAGGGGGGSGVGDGDRRGGGGGAGGLVYYDKAWSLDQESYTVEVGAGGTRGTVTTAVTLATKGGDSRFGSSVMVKGGGLGSSHNRDNSGEGGSSGGGTTHKAVGAVEQATLPGGDAAAHSFGNLGGGVGGSQYAVSGQKQGSPGGPGKLINIEKAGQKWYAAGGNAGNNTLNAGTCPTASGATSAANAEAGVAHTGNGGGGGFSTNPYSERVNGGDGGSGIVIVRFPFNY